MQPGRMAQQLGPLRTAGKDGSAVRTTCCAILTARALVCPSFISDAVIKHPDQKQLTGRKGLFGLQFQVTPIIKGKSRQEPETAGYTTPTANSGEKLISSCCVCSPAASAQQTSLSLVLHGAADRCHLQWTRPPYSN